MPVDTTFIVRRDVPLSHKPSLSPENEALSDVAPASYVKLNQSYDNQTAGYGELLFEGNTPAAENFPGDVSDEPVGKRNLSDVVNKCVREET